MKKCGVAILGLGTVGFGTYQIIENNKAHIKKTQKIDLSVESVLEINKQRIIDCKVPQDICYTKIEDIISNSSVDIVVETIGGIEPAKTLILSALQNGKSVVTANKELIAKHWRELETAAKKNNVGLYFEASCVGGVPIIRALIDSMQANKILSIYGIINGTTNYILSKMANEGLSYSDALAEAQKLGYAEANPKADVEGFDATYKLSILSSLGFAVNVPLEKIYREGITDISITDINYGKELGYTLKLLAIGKNTKEGVEVRVHPTFIKNNHSLASVNGSYNAVYVVGDSVDDIMLYGKGAGALPTGSAIVSDIIYACKEDHFYVPFSWPEKVNFITDFISDYYIRLTVLDQIGTLAKIAGVFQKYSVSINDVIQKGCDNEVPIIFITHKTHENALNKAIEEIKKLSEVTAVNAIIRVEK
ncbi:MAG: homoserine dehydrogenase [Firmicutes bacterium]|nr:homoserine dehydrogenase [Bacillota bacterium]